MCDVRCAFCTGKWQHIRFPHVPFVVRSFGSFGLALLNGGRSVVRSAYPFTSFSRGKNSHKSLASLGLSRLNAYSLQAMYTR